MATIFTTGDNNFGPTKWSVNSQAGLATHTTLASAMASASSGDSILLETSVTENVTITPGVNIVGFASSPANLPSITGTLTMTAAGTSTISGIELITNSAALLAVTGSAASIVNLYNCYLNCSNNTGISMTTSNASGLINIMSCSGNLGTTGIGYWSSSSAGKIVCKNSGTFTNTGASTTATTNSAGIVSINNSNFSCALSSTSTGGITAENSNFDCSSINTIAITLNGTGSALLSLCRFSGGTASALSIGTGVAATVTLCDINSTNTNSITGTGTIAYSALAFSGTSFKINTTTEVGGTIQGGMTQAPSAGFLGEFISTSASAVATSSNSAKTIASVNLTPGIWDISVLATSVSTGGTGLIFTQETSISTSDNAITGNTGIETFQTNTNAGGANVLSGSVPQYRVTLTANTTYYLVCLNIYTSTTCPTYGRISATRVG